MARRVPNAGLPESLNNCVLTLDGGGGYMHFLQPSATVEVQGIIGSYQYRRPNGVDAAVDVVPVGGSLAQGYCTVRHELALTGSATATEREVHYRVHDRGFMTPCSTASGRLLSPVLVAEADATLACPRSQEPWFRSRNPM
jgi:hypothetical protein